MQPSPSADPSGDPVTPPGVKEWPAVPEVGKPPAPWLGSGPGARTPQAGAATCWEWGLGTPKVRREQHPAHPARKTHPSGRSSSTQLLPARRGSSLGGSGGHTGGGAGNSLSSRNPAGRARDPHLDAESCRDLGGPCHEGWALTPWELGCGQQKAGLGQARDLGVNRNVCGSAPATCCRR